MKPISKYIYCALALLLFASCASQPVPEPSPKLAPAPTVEGVWKIEEVEVIGGPNAGVHAPQAGLVIFTKQYYSSIRIERSTPRAMWKKDPPTQAEILDAFNGFGADSGTYELNGTTMVFRPTICETPNLMAGASVTFDCQLQADSLILTVKPSGMVIPNFEQAQSQVTETRYKMRRLE